ncbi:MAG: flagellar basal-body MS-ring/collar protein FliF [Clostridiaceae bacterium]
MDKINEITLKVKGGWESIDKKKKGILIILLSIIILFVTIYSWYGNRVIYAPLFKNLELQDAATITTDLDTRGNIAYKLENGGSDIYIDDQFIDKYRLDLAMNGMIPQNSTGYEIFDNMGLMVTDEDRKIMYQRALEGELQRSVMSLSEIKTARVHLVMSEESIFDAERKEASASVIVEIKTGAKLNEDAVRGIIALISGAVENLPENNVKVIDSLGNILNLDFASSDQPSGIGLIGKQRDIKSSFEAELENSILRLLGPAFGAEKIKISIYADLDFDAEEKTVISYENPVIRSEQKSATGSGLNGDSIIDDPIGESAQNVLDNKDKEGLTSFDGTINYELTESTTNTVKAPGKVTKISTSILYDGNLTEAQSKSIRNLVSTATGYDVDRGDSISVEGVIFDKTVQEQIAKDLKDAEALEENSKSFLEQYKDFVYIGGIALLGIIFVIIVAKIIFSRGKKGKGDPYIPSIPVTSKDNIDIIEEIYKKFEVKENPKEKQIKEYAQEHPEIAADLIKAWMKD